jgi:thymidylate kinase
VSSVVELAGPAGAGKSSVFARLVARVHNVDVMPVLRTRPYVHVLATNVPAILATVVRHGTIRSLTPEKVRSMLYLRALPGLIERRPVSEGNVLVFDQGPLHLLSEAQLRDDRLNAWRKATLETWASLLDAVVWLDAPDAVLAERIDARSKWHRLKGEGLEAAIEVLEEARDAYEPMISSLEAREDGPAILRFDTSRMSPDDVVDSLLERVDGFATAARPGPPPEQVSPRG